MPTLGKPHEACWKPNDLTIINWWNKTLSERCIETLLILGINISQQSPARPTDACNKSHQTSRRLPSADVEPQSCHNPQLRLHHMPVIELLHRSWNSLSMSARSFLWQRHRVRHCYDVVMFRCHGYEGWPCEMGKMDTARINYLSQQHNTLV